MPWTYFPGSTLVQSAGHNWNVLLRYMEIDRADTASARHSLSATPQEPVDLQLTHHRITTISRFQIGLGLRNLDDDLTGESSTDVMAFVQWTLE